MVVATIMPLDLWTLFVQYVFGGFWMAVIGLTLMIFVILMLGRISIYTSTWICVMFILAMTLGYGYVTINVLITLSILIALFFSWKSYVDSK